MLAWPEIQLFSMSRSASIDDRPVIEGRRARQLSQRMGPVGLGGHVLVATVVQPLLHLMVRRLGARHSMAFSESSSDGQESRSGLDLKPCQRIMPSILAKGQPPDFYQRRLFAW